MVISSRPNPTDPEPAWSRFLAAELGGVAEYRTVDGSRVDVLTDTHAYEVEWCKKWKESIGQALHYGVMTGRKPAVILLMRQKKSELIYALRAGVACAAAGVELRFEWTV